jgi:hypothetical protein
MLPLTPSSFSSSSSSLCPFFSLFYIQEVMVDCSVLIFEDMFVICSSYNYLKDFKAYGENIFYAKYVFYSFPTFGSKLFFVSSDYLVSHSLKHL